MSQDRFRRLAGLADYHPTLEEARKEAPDLDLANMNPGQAAELYDEIRRGFEYDRLREMKLGLGSPASVASAFDTTGPDKPYTTTIDTSKLPKPDKKQKSVNKMETEEFEEIEGLVEATPKEMDSYFTSLGRASHWKSAADQTSDKLRSIESPSAKAHAAAYHAHHRAHTAWADAADQAMGLDMPNRAAEHHSAADMHLTRRDFHASRAGMK